MPCLEPCRLIKTMKSATVTKLALLRSRPFQKARSSASDSSAGVMARPPQESRTSSSSSLYSRRPDPSLSTRLKTLYQFPPHRKRRITTVFMRFTMRSKFWSSPSGQPSILRRYTARWNSSKDTSPDLSGSRSSHSARMSPFSTGPCFGGAPRGLATTHLPSFSRIALSSWKYWNRASPFVSAGRMVSWRKRVQLASTLGTSPRPWPRSWQYTLRAFSMRATAVRSSAIDRSGASPMSAGPSTRPRFFLAYSVRRNMPEPPCLRMKDMNRWTGTSTLQSRSSSFHMPCSRLSGMSLAGIRRPGNVPRTHSVSSS
mmetsp:Transcript_46804/g.138300  ORF Transcript_46804/g.138300 Transcript_46804/m.138300 type:complete len:314 (+) Transcript_46804:1938-2879(+)